MDRTGRKEGRKSIAEQVFAWLEKHPYIIWGLRNGLINYSSLTRTIQHELSLKNFDAVIIAIRRYKRNIKTADEEGITGLLNKSTVSIKTGINVYITKYLDNRLLVNLGHFHLVRGTEVSTLITGKKVDMASIKKYLGVVEISIKSPEQIEIMPGVVSTIYNKIAETGINIIETYSSYNETIFIIDKKDLTLMIEVLDRLGIG